MLLLSIGLDLLNLLLGVGLNVYLVVSASLVCHVVLSLVLLLGFSVVVDPGEIQLLEVGLLLLCFFPFDLFECLFPGVFVAFLDQLADTHLFLDLELSEADGLVLLNTFGLITADLLA